MISTLLWEYHDISFSLGDIMISVLLCDIRISVFSPGISYYQFCSRGCQDISFFPGGYDIVFAPEISGHQFFSPGDIMIPVMLWGYQDIRLSLGYQCFRGFKEGYQF